MGHLDPFSYSLPLLKYWYPATPNFSARSEVSHHSGWSFPDALASDRLSSGLQVSDKRLSIWIVDDLQLRMLLTKETRFDRTNVGCVAKIPSLVPPPLFLLPKSTRHPSHTEILHAESAPGTSTPESRSRAMTASDGPEFLQGCPRAHASSSQVPTPSHSSHIFGVNSVASTCEDAWHTWDCFCLSRSKLRASTSD